MNKPILRIQCLECGMKSMKHRVYIGKMGETAGELIKAGWSSGENGFICPICAREMGETEKDDVKKTRRMIFREIMHVMIDYIEDQAEMETGD